LINCYIHNISEGQTVYYRLERNLYQAWLFQHFELKNLFTCDGQPLSIIDPGQRNESEGPDFGNAQLLLNGSIVRGDIEIHTDNEDWYRHQHEQDPRYNNVILHVVLNIGKDRPIYTQNNRLVPVLMLKVTSESEIREQKHCEMWNGVEIEGLFEVLGKYADLRFRRKAQAIQTGLTKWTPAVYFYRMILDVLGYSQNRDSFRQLADCLPLTLLYSLLETVSDSERIITLESILFGVAGFLEQPNQKYLLSCGDYFDGLVDRWQSLRDQIPAGNHPHRWHFAGIRPVNHPTRRIAALAQILTAFYPNDPAQSWINQVITQQSCNELIAWARSYFQRPVGIWRNHPLFIRSKVRVLLGSRRLMDLVSNLLLPFAAAVAAIRQDKKLHQKATSFAREIPRGEIPAKILKWNQSLHLSPNTLSKNYLIQGAIEFNRRFCELNLCKLCPLENYAHR
jgi:hypothetical protein